MATAPMPSSTSIGSLAKALTKAKLTMEAPTKNKVNPHFKSAYADLAAIKSSYQKALGDNGLSIVNTMSFTEGHLLLRTSLVHAESGEWIASDYPIPTFSKPQETGSAVTYGRRYNVCALLDIVAEDDDDGNAASNPGAASLGPAPVKTKEEKAEATEAKFEDRQKEAQRLAFECADFSKKSPEEEMMTAAGVKKASDMKTIKHCESAIDNLLKRAKTLEASGATPF